MNNNKKGLWVLLIVVLVILIIWGIVSAYNHSEMQNGAQGELTPATSGDTTSGASGNGSGAAANNSAVGVSSITPASGKAGTQVAIAGFGFTPTDNTITFSGFALVDNARSSDGVHLSFTLPDSLRMCSDGSCANPVVKIQPGSYPMTVMNANGHSNVVYFNVTQAGSAQ